jgi:hypothetical protein
VYLELIQQQHEGRKETDQEEKKLIGPLILLNIFITAVLSDHKGKAKRLAEDVPIFQDAGFL